MKDGVEYVLRFGDIAGSGPAKKDDEARARKGRKDEKDKKGGGLNRYLFVMAEFNPDIIPKPQLEPLPQAKKDAEKKPAEEKKPDDKKADEKKADAKKPTRRRPSREEGRRPRRRPRQEGAEDAERERIEKENKRKQEEYDQKIADGKKRVGELNARFADWYYVISDEVYPQDPPRPRRDLQEEGEGQGEEGRARRSRPRQGRSDAADPLIS